MGGGGRKKRGCPSNGGPIRWHLGVRTFRGESNTWEKSHQI